MNSLFLDVLTAVRFFARRRIAFIVIALTLALALAANIAVFAALQAFLFTSLGTPASDEVGLVWTTRELPGRGRVDFCDAYPNARLLPSSTGAFSATGITFPVDLNWEQAEAARRLHGARVTADFFAVTQVRPVLGRLLTADDEGPEARPVALVSASLWREAFSGRADILGRTLILNGTRHTIVGVLPAGLALPRGVEVWLPFDLPDTLWTAINGARQLNVYARLAPGVSRAEADAALEKFALAARAAHPANDGWSWRFQPLREYLLGGADRVVTCVQVGAGVLLLLALSNLGSLLLGWAAERQRDTALRLALGATTAQLAQPFLVQSLLLVLLSGGLGVFLAWLALPALQALNPDPALSGFVAHVQLNPATLGFSAAVILASGVLGGLLPAWLSRSVSFSAALRSDPRCTGVNPAALRWQCGLVVFQAAVSVLILVSALLAALGLYRLSRTDLGFATADRVVLHLEFSESTYPTHADRARFVRHLEQHLARESALEHFGVVSSLPVGDTQWGGGFHPERVPGTFNPEESVLHLRRTTPGYFATVAIPLLAGRLLAPGDRADSRPVAVISQAAADKFWPGENPVGRRLRRSVPGEFPVVEIVGVVGNVRDSGANLPPGETLYVPYDQLSLRRSWIVLHGRGSVGETIAAGRRALHATDPAIAPYDINTLDQLAWQAGALPRLLVVLLGAFAVIAAGITALGSYGVMNQLVATQRKELAIRAALGATGAAVLGHVLLQNARLAATGVLLGLAAAWVVAQLLAATLTGFPAYPVWPYAVVAAGVLAVTQLASLIPARRAARLDARAVLSGV